jgi:hypothetical protein
VLVISLYLLSFLRRLNIFKGSLGLALGACAFLKQMKNSNADFMSENALVRALFNSMRH